MFQAILLALPLLASASTPERAPALQLDDEVRQFALFRNDRPQSGCVSNLGLEDRWCQQFDYEECRRHRVRCHWR